MNFFSSRSFATLALLGLLASMAGPASAQSSVSIWGIMDLGLAKRNDGTAQNPGAPKTSGWTIQSSTVSRLGFMIKEDLGSGWSTQAELTHFLNADDGTGFFPNNFWGGKSLLQLNNTSLGSIYFGRDFIPAWWPALFADPFEWDSVGQNSTNQWANYFATAGLRTNNSIGYKSPNWGGLTVQVATSFGEDVVGRDSGFNVQYRRGPHYAGMGYDRISGGPNPLSAGNSLLNFAYSYDFGVARLSAYAAQTKTAGGTLKNKDYLVGALIPMGAGKLKLSYNRLVPAGSNNRQSKLSAGYEHYLSKRTNIYTNVGFARQDARTNSQVYDVGIRMRF